MKTPEQLAEEYVDNRPALPNCVDNTTTIRMQREGYDAFLAGYRAAKDQVADADKVMNSSNNSNGWISVKDRLPEESTHCVIRIDDGEYQVAWREDGHWIMFNPCCIYNSQLNNVTHWMPLPKPPEE